MNRLIPIKIYMYSLLIFYILTKANRLLEKCLLFDLKAVKNSYKNMEMESKLRA